MLSFHKNAKKASKEKQVPKVPDHPYFEAYLLRGGSLKPFRLICRWGVGPQRRMQWGFYDQETALAKIPEMEYEARAKWAEAYTAGVFQRFWQGLGWRSALAGPSVPPEMIELALAEREDRVQGQQIARASKQLASVKLHYAARTEARKQRARVQARENGERIRAAKKARAQRAPRLRLIRRK